MARTMLNPSTQLTASTVYVSASTAGSTLQTGALTAEDDLNALRSQVSRLLDATQGGNWYDDIYTTASGQKRSVKQLNSNLDTLQNKTLLARVASSASVAVPSGQNYVVLSAANGQAPSSNIAVALTQNGAVCAQSTFNGAAFAANELTALAGNTSSSPKNLLVIRDATTLQTIESGGFDVFALLQVESTATDGGNFNDTSGGSRGKLSFVTINSSTGSLQAAAATDMAGHTVQYSYVLRSTLSLMPEQNFLGSGVFTDAIADTNITLTRATANQAGSPIPVSTDVLWRVANGTNFKVQNGAGSTDLFGVSPSSGANAAYFNTDTFAVATTSAPTFSKGVSVATGGQAINVGVTMGLISTTGALTLQTLGANPMSLASSGTLAFTDGYEASGGWTATSIPLASNAADWSSYKAYYGEASLLSGILQAGQRASHSIKWGAVTSATIPAGTNITGAGSSANLDAQLLNYAGMANYATQVKVYVNGNLLRPGSSATDTTQDWYPGTNPATGDIKLTFALRGLPGRQDQVVVEVHENPLDNA